MSLYCPQYFLWVDSFGVAGGQFSKFLCLQANVDQLKNIYPLLFDICMKHSSYWHDNLIIYVVSLRHKAI